MTTIHLKVFELACLQGRCVSTAIIVSGAALSELSVLQRGSARTGMGQPLRLHEMHCRRGCWYHGCMLKGDHGDKVHTAVWADGRAGG
jgi:hypothetical protein